MKEQWKEGIRRKLADYKQSAPELSWADIDSAIAKQKPSRTRAKVVPMWLKSAISIAAIVLVVVGLFMIIPQNKTNNKANFTAKQKDTSHSYPTNSLNTTDNNGSLVAYTPTYRSEKSMENHNEYYEVANSESINEVIKPIEEVIKPIETSKFNQQNDKQNDKNQQVDRQKDISHSSNSASSQATYSTQYNHKKQVPHGLAVRAYLANVVTGNASSNVNGLTLAAAKPIGDSFTPAFSSSAKGVQVMDADVNTNTKHRQPVRIGVKVKYDLNNRWAIESGLTYTYLSSDIDRKVGNNSYNTTQQLNYIGIPLNINYNIWNNKHLNVYAAAGGRAEKMVKGKTILKYAMNDDLQSTTKEDIKINPLQWSVNAGVGIEYSPVKNLGVYVEPGVSYYIKSQNKVETIYNDKPFNLDLNVGIRINIR